MLVNNLTTYKVSNHSTIKCRVASKRPQWSLGMRNSVDHIQPFTKLPFRLVCCKRKIDQDCHHSPLTNPLYANQTLLKVVICCWKNMVRQKSFFCGHKENEGPTTGTYTRLKSWNQRGFLNSQMYQRKAKKSLKRSRNMELVA